MELRWRLVACSVAPCVGIMLGWAGGLSGQSSEPEIELTGRVHAQFNTTGVDGEIGSEFFIRRARLTAEIQVNDWVSGKVQPDFGDGKISLKDAYVDLAFSPHFNFTMGQFKRPFDLFELESSTRTLVIERAGTIRGVDTCAGVGGICSFSRFTEELDYSNRDIGARVSGETGISGLSYAVSLTNGEGANTRASNSRKSYTARLEYDLSGDLSVGANIGSHDYENTIDNERDYGTAYGVDVEWGSYSSMGWHVKAGAITGDNWKNLAGDGAPTTFLATQGIVAYRIPIEGNDKLFAVEPLVRVSWADPDKDTDDDAGVFSTAGFVFHLVGRNRIAANLETWDPAVGDREWSLKVQSYLHF